MGETTHGGLAELCRVRAHQLIRLPDYVGFTEAAAIPVVYGTAIRMMHTIGRVEKDEKVWSSARAAASACPACNSRSSPAQRDRLRQQREKAAKLMALGADRTIDYVKDDFVKEIFALYGKPTRRGPGATNGVDVVVNYTGGDTWVKSLRCLRVGGRILTCGATAGYNPMEDLRYVWTFELQVRGSNGYRREDVEKGTGACRERSARAACRRGLAVLSGRGGPARLRRVRCSAKVVIVP